MRGAIVIGLALLLAAGCGSPVREAARSKPPACPPDAALDARDVIGKPPPSGFAVDPGDRRRLRAFALQFKPSFGEDWRGYDAAVLLRRGRINGAAVIVLNANEAARDKGDLIRGMESGAREQGRAIEPIEIAGEEGRLVQAPDGAYIAMAPAGDCAALVMVADRERLLRDAAEAIPRQ